MSARPAHALVVEASEETSSQIQRVLVEQGFTVSVVNTGKAALAALERKACRIIYCGADLKDLELPEFLDAIRHRIPDVPVIALIPERLQPEELEKLRGAGLASVLPKPPTDSGIVREFLKHLGPDGQA